MDNQSSEILTEKEAAKVLSLSVFTLRNRRCQRQKPDYLKYGGRAVRYRRSDLEAFINSHLVTLEQ
ncbi:MAG: helix-turn-helix domain-containing protein [Desulfobacteraceae bacterium]|jgi:predicted DNA-binding transcriptional regulator AlpA